ncbi:MAG: hypothetical protein KDE19_22415, partial [Caldilineaceae bacterium]|nr:hypothetical protein [Caldilineaceae bacterium]
VAARNRHAFALEFFQAARARQAQLPGPPPLGLHVLMGESTGNKLGNMVGGIVAGHIAPVELIVKKKME